MANRRRSMSVNLTLAAALALLVGFAPSPAIAAPADVAAQRAPTDTRTISVPATLDVVTDVGPDKRCLVYALIKWPHIPEADDSTTHVVHYVSHGTVTSKSVVAPFNDTVPGVVAPLTVEPGHHWVSVAQAGAMDVNNPSGCPQAAAAFRTSYVPDRVKITVADECAPAKRALKRAKKRLQRLKTKADDARGERLRQLRKQIRSTRVKVRKAKATVNRVC